MSTSGGKTGLDTNLTQGPFEFGPSQFDIGAIMDAIGGNQSEIEARYKQLGLGGSTMEKQDLANQTELGQAAQGQLQESEVGQPAFNPALQPAQTNLPNSSVLAANQGNLSNILKDAGTLAGIASGLPL